ncbi:MAG: hypothetical protein IPK64_13505 [bacterium]|nr:hypothetical protein [bacterium]
MKTSVIAHRSLLRGTLSILAALITLTALAWLLPARAEAAVRVQATVGGVAVDYRDRGPGHEARADIRLEPLGARVLVGRPVCSAERPDCLVRVVDRCRKHDRDHDGRCDKCERRERRQDRRDGRREACDDRDHRNGLGRCEHSERCDACRTVEVGGCRDHRGMTWVVGRYERIPSGHGRGGRVWVPGHWERTVVVTR